MSIKQGIISAVVFLCVVIGVTFYIQSLRADLEKSERNNQLLQQSIEQQSLTIDQMEQSYSKILNLNAEISENINKVNDNIRKYQNTITQKTDQLAKVAVGKSSLTEKIINDATTKQLKCFELITRGQKCD